MIILPHSANHEVHIENFVAAWINWVERFHRSRNWDEFHFPFDWKKENLAPLIQGGRISGLDAMCRFLAPTGARNTRQVSHKFLEDNNQWLEKCEDAISSRGRHVIGAVLKEQTVNLWNSLPESDKNRHTEETAHLASEFFQKFNVS
jgi:hypothetical protein